MKGPLLLGCAALLAMAGPLSAQEAGWLDGFEALSTDDWAVVTAGDAMTLLTPLWIGHGFGEDGLQSLSIQMMEQENGHVLAEVQRFAPDDEAVEAERFRAVLVPDAVGDGWELSELGRQHRCVEAEGEAIAGWTTAACPSS